MPLTRAWAIILAFLATACLAGMFLLSGSSGGGFTEADRAAVRAVTEAGVAALEAQLQASPVQQIAGLPQDARLKDLLVAEPSKDDPDALEADLYDALGEASEELRVRTSSNMTVAVITMAGTVTGALVGVVAGALLPAGRRWVDLRGERLIRVGAVELRPALRVSLDERRR